MVPAIPLASAPFNPGPPSVAVASTASVADVSTAWREGLVEDARPAPGSGRTGG